MSYNTISQYNITSRNGEFLVDIPHCVKLVKAVVHDDLTITLFLLHGHNVGCITRKIVLVDLSYPAGLIEDINSRWSEYLGNDLTNAHAIFVTNH